MCVCVCGRCVCVRQANMSRVAGSCLASFADEREREKERERKREKRERERERKMSHISMIGSVCVCV